MFEEKMVPAVTTVMLCMEGLASGETELSSF